MLFQDHGKGNCFDCHGREGRGIATFGSTNLDQPDLVFGADRDAILESITKGRHGRMPAFGTVLKPEELNAVSVFGLPRPRPRIGETKHCALTLPLTDTRSPAAVRTLILSNPLGNFRDQNARAELG